MDKRFGEWLVHLHTRCQLGWRSVPRKELVQRIEGPLFRLPPGRLFPGVGVGVGIGDHAFLYDTQHD